MKLDQVLHLPALAVDVFVEVLRRVFERGDDTGSDFSSSCINHLRPSARRGLRPTWRPPGSRPRSMRAHHVLRPRRVTQSLAITLMGMLPFRYTDSVGTRNQFSNAAQWLACTFPCRRFADTFPDACARLGSFRYSFIVVDLHHSLLAGAPWEMRRQRREQGTVTNRTELVSPRWQKGRQGSESVGTRQAQAPLQRGESS